MTETSTTAAPTVVLVHGAFADSSSWSGVIERLQAKGVQVTAAAVPLRGLTTDSAYVAGVLEQTPGPVIAVGHSYGGAVITNAAARATNVVGLVFVAAFAPDAGERLGEASAASKDSVLMSTLVPRRYPVADCGEPAFELMIDPARFRDAFAADLPAGEAAIMAATQRPLADRAFSDVTEAAAWRTLPSWAIVATADRAAGTDVTRSMARRAGATITEIDSSHVVMVSHPQEVALVIQEAIAAVGAVAVG
jgi:pimeloyl-ACP methyl ester carboxylesterase